MIKMSWRAVIFAIIVCVRLVQSAPQIVLEDDAYAILADNLDVELISTAAAGNEIPKVELNRNITVDENTDAILKCTPNFEGDSVQWLLNGFENNEEIWVTSKPEAKNLTIQNVTRSHAGVYTCRKSNVLEHFHLNVIAASIRFSNESHIFIRNGGTIDLTCVTTSVRSVEEITWNLNNTVIEPEQTLWQTMARKCMTKERDNCVIHTTFGLKIENASSANTGFYTCMTASFKVEPAVVFVEVIDQPVIIKMEYMSESSKIQIIEFATKAMELHGVNQMAAEYVRDKCQAIFPRQWNCIVGRQFHARAMSTGNFGSEYASIEFSMGLTHFSVFQSYY